MKNTIYKYKEYKMEELRKIYDDYDPADRWVFNGDQVIERENDKYWKRQPEKFNDSGYDAWKNRNDK
jgi:hypothetical protein